jgi:SAM-dependent methyltransferase
MSAPLDYDDPGRFRLARATWRAHGAGEDVHPVLARRCIAAGHLPVLDVGCGEGELARYLPADTWLGVDSAPAMLAALPPALVGHAAQATATALPHATASVGAVALLYVLHHLDEAQRGLALAEAHRVVRPGGIVAVAQPGRTDSPELAAALAGPVETFAAEDAPAALTAAGLGDVEVLGWDAPLVTLPDPGAVRDYLVGRQVDPAVAARHAEWVDTPLAVTKRGALVIGRR